MLRARNISISRNFRVFIKAKGHSHNSFHVKKLMIFNFFQFHEIFSRISNLELLFEALDTDGQLDWPARQSFWNVNPISRNFFWRLHMILCLRETCNGDATANAFFFVNSSYFDALCSISWAQPLKTPIFRETSTSTHFDEKSTFFFMNSSYFDALWSLFNLLASKLFRETSTFTCLDSLRLILFNLFLFLQSKFRGDGDFGELNVD